MWGFIIDLPKKINENLIKVISALSTWYVIYISLIQRKGCTLFWSTFMIHGTLPCISQKKALVS